MTTYRFRRLMADALADQTGEKAIRLLARMLAERAKTIRLIK
jgi:hypothetical protein